MLHWEVDEHKQHSMNENVMVHNVKELDGEDAVQIVTQLVNESGVECVKEDLFTAHRVGKRSADLVRPLVAKFVRKDMRTNLLRKGRRERERSELQWVKEARVYEQLTPWRSRLLRMVRGDEGVEKAWTREGKVVVVLKDGERRRDGSEVYVFINDRRDLHGKLGWDEDRLTKSGLFVDIGDK